MIDPELKMWLDQTWPRDQHAPHPDPFEAFFERREIEKSLGGTTLPQPTYDNPALDDLHAFVKAERQKVPQMTTREIRFSAAHVLRKAADRIAAIGEV
jgi:hypothetical protein